MSITKKMCITNCKWLHVTDKELMDNMRESLNEIKDPTIFIGGNFYKTGSALVYHLRDVLNIEISILRYRPKIQVEIK